MPSGDTADESILYFVRERGGDESMGVSLGLAGFRRIGRLMPVLIEERTLLKSTFLFTTGLNSLSSTGSRFSTGFVN